MGFYCKLQIILICIVLGGYISACATVNNMKRTEEKFETKIWHEEPQNKDIKAVIILLHGLNLRPQRMDDWSKTLSAHGAKVIRFALYGHTGDFAHMKNVTPDLWRKQFREAIEVAKANALTHNVPIYFIGFSLGALVGLEWLANEDNPNHIFNKMVLIAPALSVAWYSQAAINLLSIFGKGLILPSRSPLSYRANKGTSIAAYQSLFELKKSLEQKKYRNANVNTLVLIDRDDELVDSRGIQKIISQFKLSHWILEIVDNRFAYDNYGFRHLMVDEEAIGKVLWKSLSEMVIRHFGLNHS